MSISSRWVALIFWSVSWGIAEPAVNPEMHAKPASKPETSKKTSTLKLSAFLHLRTADYVLGALTWDELNLVISPSILLFDRVSMRAQPHLSYSHFGRADKYEWVTGLERVNDVPMIVLVPRERDFRNQRKDAYEGFTRLVYKFGFRELLHTGLVLRQGIFGGHQGFHGEVLFGFPIAPYVKLNTVLGVGTSEANLYAYGKDAVSGPGHFSATGSFFFPWRTWDGILLFNFISETVLQSENRRAEYVRGDYANFGLSATFLWHLFEI